MAQAERAKTQRGSNAGSTGRPRSEEAHQAILDATLALLVEVGFSALTVEGVAQRAGVGKATIYRRWASKLPLVVEAFSQLPGFEEVDSGSLEADLKETLKTYLNNFNSTSLGAVFPSLAGERAHNPGALEAARARGARSARALRADLRACARARRDSGGRRRRAGRGPRRRPDLRDALLPRRHAVGAHGGSDRRPRAVGDLERGD